MKPEFKHREEHEITRWHAKPFVIGTILFFVFMTFVYVIVGGLTVSWTNHVWPPKGSVTGPQAESQWNNSAPQLEIDGPVPLKQLREKESQRLNTLRWADDTHQFATIPIDQAMTLLTQADADHRLNQLLPEPKPATPIDLQNQKSTEVAPAPKLP